MNGQTPPDVAVRSAPEPRSARKLHAIELFEGLPRRYDRLSALLSFGQDPRWRRALVGAIAARPEHTVLDVATGTGLVAAELLARGGCAVVAVDQSPQMLAAARERFAAAQARAGALSATSGAVRLVQAEAEDLPFETNSFDGLTVTYLLRYVDDPAATIRELARVLRPGGRIASLEFGVPSWAPARWAWRLYTFNCLPALARAVSAPWGAVGSFLGPSIVGFYEQHPLPRIVEYWRAAGLEEVAIKRLSFGGGIIITARKATAERPAPGGAAP